MPLRTMQIICGALAGGLFAMTVAMGAVAYARSSPVSPALLAPLAGAAALSIPACVLVGIAVRSSILQQARLAWLREPGADQAAAVRTFEEAYGRALLIQAAAIEGFGVLGATCALVTGQLLFLLSPLLAILAIGIIFPTENKFQAVVAHLTRPAEEREMRFIEAQRADSR
jgi:hypothetical protein